MLDEAEKIGCKQFVAANDVVKGREKLNIAFTANLLNNYPNMDPPEVEEEILETREEKSKFEHIKILTTVDDRIFVGRQCTETG